MLPNQSITSNLTSNGKNTASNVVTNQSMSGQRSGRMKMAGFRTKLDGSFHFRCFFISATLILLVAIQQLPLAQSLQVLPLSIRKSTGWFLFPPIQQSYNMYEKRPMVHSAIHFVVRRRTLHQNDMAGLSSVDNESEPKSKKKNEQGSPPISVKLIGNFVYALTAPFPGLRKVLIQQTSRKEDKRFYQQPSMAISLRTALFAVGIYLSIGILAYHLFLEKWPIVDAIYFSCVCFSTVGYGDLCPTTTRAKLFTCLFGFSGIALLGAIVASLGSKLVRLELEAVHKVQKEGRKRLIAIYDDLMPKILHHTQNATSVYEKTEIFRQVQSETNTTTILSPSSLTIVEEEESLPSLLSKQVPLRTRVWRATKWMSKSLMVIIASGLLIGRFEGWSILDSIYYSLVTATTIGLGDISPQTKNGRITAIILIPTLVAAAGEILAGIGLALVERRQKEVYQAQLKTGLSMEFIQQMDTNGDGKVSREEYIFFMLLEMGVVNKHELDELCNQFKRLDVTRSGYIDKMDLLLMQMLREEADVSDVDSTV